jgi:hypothetical protein
MAISVRGSADRVTEIPITLNHGSLAGRFRDASRQAALSEPTGSWKETPSMIPSAIATR